MFLSANQRADASRTIRSRHDPSDRLFHMRHLRKILPLLISLALIGWLFGRVSQEELLGAMDELHWQLLLPLTGLLVVFVYLWEALCFQVLFSLDERPLTYRQMLHVRGISYLAGVVYYKAGQAVVALRISQLQRTGLLSALSRTVLLAYHDLLVLFGLGTLGAVLATDPRASQMRWIYATVLLLLASLSLLTFALPASQLRRLKQTRWGAWIECWSWKRSACLLMLRIFYFSIFIFYAGAALSICRILVDGSVVLGTIPLVLLADSLPSASGLGTRDAALQLLLNPQRRETLLAMSLIWSTGILFGRLAIGVATLWLSRCRGGWKYEERDAEPTDAQEAAEVGTNESVHA